MTEVEPKESTSKKEVSERGLIILDALENRRSYRRFTGESVEDELVDKILAAALRAPSSKNAQPWRFHVVRQGNMLHDIAEMFDDPEVLTSRPIDPITGKPNEQFGATVAESADVIRHAPVTIFIENTSPFMGGRANVLQSPYISEVIHGHDFEMLGLGAAIGNLYTATEAVGLGGVFMGDIIVKEAQIKEKLGIKGDVVGVFAFGHPAQTRQQLWAKPLAPRGDKIVHH